MADGRPITGSGPGAAKSSSVSARLIISGSIRIAIHMIGASRKNRIWRAAWMAARPGPSSRLRRWCPRRDVHRQRAGRKIFGVIRSDRFFPARLLHDLPDVRRAKGPVVVLLLVRSRQDLEGTVRFSDAGPEGDHGAHRLHRERQAGCHGFPYRRQSVGKRGTHLRGAYERRRTALGICRLDGTRSWSRIYNHALHSQNFKDGSRHHGTARGFAAERAELDRFLLLPRRRKNVAIPQPSPARHR